MYSGVYQVYYWGSQNGTRITRILGNPFLHTIIAFEENCPGCISN